METTQETTLQRKAHPEIGGDSRIRYNNGGDADARVRVAGRWNITDNTSIQAGGEKNVE